MATIRLLAPVLFAVAALAPAQIIDYHQHLYSPVAGPISVLGWKGVTDELIHPMDEAHVSRAGNSAGIQRRPRELLRSASTRCPSADSGRSVFPRWFFTRQG